MTSRHLVVRRCRRCGVRLWFGLDGDVAARDAWIEPAALTVAGEGYAVLSGRDTYSVEYRPRAASIAFYRPVWNIGADNLGSIHAAHICNRPIPELWKRPNCEKGKGWGISGKAGF